MPSRSSNVPLNIRDAHFLPRLLVIVKPLAFGQIDARELGAGLEAHGLPFALSGVSFIGKRQG